MKRKLLSALLYGTLTLMVVGVMSFIIFKPILVLPRLALGPGFGLIAANGEKITNETQRGKITLYSFTYTNCEGTCPLLMEKIKKVRERLNEVEEIGDLEVELVTISIDPERDSPEMMAQYAANLGVKPGVEEKGLVPWRFLTGDNPVFTKIMVSSGFDLFHEKVFSQDGSPDEYQYNFVPMAVLVDGWGIIRSEYRQYEDAERLSFSEGRTDIDPDILLRDIGLVADEANKSTGVASAGYEAAHLFLCYPP